MRPRNLELYAYPATTAPFQPDPLTLQLISSKEGSQAVFQGDDWPPKPARGTGYHKPTETERECVYGGGGCCQGLGKSKTWGPGG